MLRFLICSPTAGTYLSIVMRALAWRISSFDRRHVSALTLNQSAERVAKRVPALPTSCALSRTEANLKAGQKPGIVLDLLPTY